MTPAETLGYLACGLVLLTFGMRTMRTMRIAAIGSNLAFIAYGLALDLPPIWSLHTALLPLNAYRLLELQRGGNRRHIPQETTPSGPGDGVDLLPALPNFHRGSTSRAKEAVPELDHTFPLVRQ
jgi:hypothetical protein